MIYRGTNYIQDDLAGRLRKFRDECLSMEWFRNRLEARVIIEDRRQHYNAVRPHSSLNYLTPNEFVAGLQNNLPTDTRELSSMC